MVDDSSPLLVRIVIGFEAPEYPGVRQSVMYEIVDRAPEFPVSQKIMMAYGGSSNVELNVWHYDLPKPAGRPTHMAPSQLN